MKIAFDEHVPITLVRAFDALANERQIRKSIGTKGFPADLKVVAARSYAPSPTDDDFAGNSDVPWMERFAADGGDAIISGNVKMLEVPQEILAIQRLKLVAIFFDPKWNNWDFFEKASLLLWHWKSIVATIKAARPATVYRVPSNWTQLARLQRLPGPKGTLRTPELASPIGAGARMRQRRRKKPSPIEGQGDLPLPAEEK